MSAIYILWLRQLKRYVRSRPRIIGVARPAAAVSAGAWASASGRSSKGRAGQLHPVPGAGRDRR